MLWQEEETRSRRGMPGEAGAASGVEQIRNLRANPERNLNAMQAAIVAPMRDPLDPIIFALGPLTKAELRALQMAVAASPRMAPSLLVYLMHACGWEARRRKRQWSTLRPPTTVIHPGKRDEAFAALVELMVIFGDEPNVRALLDAIGAALDESTTD